MTNPSHQTTNRILADESVSQEMLDLLADGELSRDEQRELVARLEEAPERWKDCALAFMQHQALGQDLAGLKSFGDDAPAAEVQPVSRPRTWDAHRVGWSIALAASLLVAFMAGLLVGPGVEPNPPAPKGGMLASDESAQNAERPQKRGQEAPQPPVVYVGDVTLAGNSPQDRVRVPVLEGPGMEDLLRENPMPMPVEVRRMLEHFGHELRRERRFIPVELEDGRRVIIPVEEWEIRHRSPEYQ